MHRAICTAVLSLLTLIGAFASAAEDQTSERATGLDRPQAVAVAEDGRIFVTVLGQAGEHNGGKVVVLQNGKTQPFASGFGRPQGIVGHSEFLFVADGDRVVKIDHAGKTAVLSAADAFPSRPKNLASIAVDFQKGLLYVGDLGDDSGNGAAIYRVGTTGSVDTIVTRKTRSEL